MHQATDNDIERFWSKVKKTETCWLWEAGKFYKGYGLFRYKGKLVRAHRFSWSIFHKQNIPDGMQINHHCDNPACVNPEHLYLGTQKDNRRDSIVRNRTAKGTKNGMYTHPESRLYGDKNPNAKLTISQVVDIRNSYVKGEASLGALAKRYGVTKQTIYYQVHKKMLYG
jgi:hypothetical protein